MIDHIWLKHVHSRAWEAFKSEEQLREVLRRILESVDRSQDPIIGTQDDVLWHGEFHGPDPIVTLLKPGATTKSSTYVNRVLALIFASDESFEALNAKPRDPLTMTCGNKRCINLSHVSVG